MESRRDVRVLDDSRAPGGSLWESRAAQISEDAVVRSTLPNISESGTPLGLRGTINEFVCGKVAIFQNGVENHLELNQSRNIHFGLASDDEFCAILS